MPAFIYILIGFIACCALTPGESPPERLSLKEKTEQATLVVVGTMSIPAQTHGKDRVVAIKVENVLFTSHEVTKTLEFSYRRSSLSDPGVYSHSGTLIKSNTKCIFFLTSDGGTNSSSNLMTRAVGPFAYAHDAIEVLDTNKLREVTAMTMLQSRSSN